MSVLAAIGNTPLVELRNLNGNSNVRILAKLEGANPGGSVKDRPAHYMIQKAEEAGELKAGKTILEPTSGNTGIALAMIGAAKGYPVKLMMPACVSVERQRVLEALGADLVLTPGEESTDGAIRRAHEVANKEPDRFYMPNQFDNPNNPLSHYETTGPEILDQTNGEIDAFVAGIGTSGTLMGTGRFLREKNKNVEIIGVEPVEGHKVQGLKNLCESMVPGIYAPDEVDQVVSVDDDESFETTRRLATREGLFVGMSCGAAVAGALKLARDMSSGTIVTILPDRGDRYLSTALFTSVCADCPP